MNRPKCWPAVLILGLAWAAGSGAVIPPGGSPAAPADGAATANPGGPPAPSADAVNARRLGITESMVKYCARLDAPDAERLRKKARHLVQGQSDRAVARIRRSQAYRSGYEAMSAFAAKVDDHNARRACSEALAGNK